ncbi:MAG TPA: type II secretion system F family protein [Deltaproteobacteria bacterium]|nr:type II secretion system F family protein [Deltaproteobacteria bacterium]
MPLYSYTAKDASGKVVKGYLEASHYEEAIRKIRARWLWPVRVKEAQRKGVRVPLSALADLTRELKELLEGGLPLDRALQMLASSQEQGKVKVVLEDLLEKVRTGKRLSEALSAHPKAFGRLYVQMVRVGEATGNIPQALGLILDYLERERDARERLLSILLYPAILTMVGTVSVIVLLTYVIPRFVQIFTELQQDIPPLLALLEGVGRGLRLYGWLLPVALLALYLLSKGYLRAERGRRALHSLLISNRLVGPFVVRFELAKLGRTVGVMLASGVSIMEALDVGKEVVGNLVLREEIGELRRQVRRGRAVSAFFRRRPFPPKVATVLAVAEERGDLASGFLTVGRQFDEDLQRWLKRALSLFEPVVIITMGLIIGVIILTMFRAIVGINEIKL